MKTRKPKHWQPDRELGFAAEPFKLVSEKAPETEFVVPVSTDELLAVKPIGHNTDLFGEAQ